MMCCTIIYEVVFMKMKKVLFVLPIAISLVACGNDGNGGSDPLSGEMFLHASGAPSNLIGNTYSHYYDESTGYVWEKNDGVWFNKFVKASSALYSKPNKRSNRAITDEKRNEIINAFAMSFYSTNGTVDVGCQYEGSDYFWSFTAAFSKQDICIIPEWSVNPEDNIIEYYRIDEEGKLYGKNEGGLYELIDNDNVYCVVPHSCVETIVYDNFLMYDDTFGNLTGIIAGNLDKFEYDEAKDTYFASEIEISHGPITSYYVHEPTSDVMKFSYSFKLSSDSSYVESAKFTILDGVETAGYIGMSTTFTFSKIHSTVITVS